MMELQNVAPSMFEWGEGRVTLATCLPGLCNHEHARWAHWGRPSLPTQACSLDTLCRDIMQRTNCQQEPAPWGH